jgi:opacity protein-like surface antigen
MKKLIAILAVFAIMVPALFAQDAGEWSIGGKGQIGTRVDVTPWELRSDDNENSDQPVPLVGMTSYEDYQAVTGNMNLTYRRGGISTGLAFEQTDVLNGFVEFNNENVNFKAVADLRDLLTGFAGLNSSGVNAETGRPANLGRTETFVSDFGAYYSYRNSQGQLRYRAYNTTENTYFGRAIRELHGGFKFLDGIIDLQVAVRSNWRHNLWVSSTILPNDTYSIVQGGNFLSLNVAPIDGFTVGFILPGIFDIGFDTWANNLAHTRQNSLTPMGSVNGPATTGYAGLVDGAYRRLVQDSVERMTFGLKYGTGPFNAAVQYGLRGRPMFYEEGSQNIRDTTFLNSVLYFGAQYNLTSAMTIDIEAKGEFFKSFDTNRDSPDTALEDVSRTALAFGGRFRYTDGPLQAYLTVMYFNDIWTAGWAGIQLDNTGNDQLLGNGGSIATTPNSSRSVEGGVVRLRPFFRYNVVPSHLQFRVDTLLDIPLSEWTLNRFDPWETDVKTEQAEGDDLRGYRNIGNGIRAYSLGYQFVPEVFFNVMGTGATDGVNMDNNFTGIAVRYRLAGLMYTGNLFNKRASHPTRNAFDIIFRWSF